MIDLLVHLKNMKGGYENLVDTLQTTIDNIEEKVTEVNNFLNKAKLNLNSIRGLINELNGEIGDELVVYDDSVNKETNTKSDDENGYENGCKLFVSIDDIIGKRKLTRFDDEKDDTL